MSTNKLSEVAIALPFSIDSFGNVAVATTQEKIWADRVRSVVGTIHGERVFRNLFGTEIPLSMFETQTVMEATIKREISNAFQNFLSLLTLLDVVISFDEEANVITADVTYSTPTNTTSTTSVSLLSISGNQIPYEEKL